MQASDWVGWRNMNDTPNFLNIQTRFSNYGKDPLIAAGTNQPIHGQEAEILNKVFEEFPNYFSDTAFRQKLTSQAKDNIESQINATCDQFDRINNERASNNLPAHIAEIGRNLSSYLEEFRYRYSYPRRLDTLEGGQNVAETLQQIEKTKETASKSLEEIENVLTLSRELVGFKGDAVLADHFHRLYNGLTFGEMEEKKHIPKRTNKLRSLVSSRSSLEKILIIMVIALGLSYTAEAIYTLLAENDLTKMIIFISVLAFFVAISALRSSFGVFNARYHGGYERASAFWALGVVISLIAVGAYSYFAVKALKIDSSNINLGEVLIKAVVLVAPLYLVRFCARNFSANRHLATTNLQRAVSIRVFRPFVEELKGDAAEAQREAYTKITEIIFRQDETGFITRREGAGSPSPGSGPFSG